MIGLNWGNGFVTDPQLISSRGLSNPTNFFNQLVRKPYAKKVQPALTFPLRLCCGFCSRSLRSAGLPACRPAAC